MPLFITTQGGKLIKYDNSGSQQFVKLISGFSSYPSIAFDGDVLYLYTNTSSDGYKIASYSLDGTKNGNTQFLTTQGIRTVAFILENKNAVLYNADKEYLIIDPNGNLVEEGTWNKNYNIGDSVMVDSNGYVWTQDTSGAITKNDSNLNVIQEYYKNVYLIGDIALDSDSVNFYRFVERTV